MKEKHLFFKILLVIISISFMSIVTTVSCADFKNKNSFFTAVALKRLKRLSPLKHAGGGERF